MMASALHRSPSFYFFAHHIVNSDLLPFFFTETEQIFVLLHKLKVKPVFIKSPGDSRTFSPGSSTSLFLTAGGFDHQELHLIANGVEGQLLDR